MTGRKRTPSTSLWFAAASLVDAFGEIGGDVQEATLNVSITIETIGSQPLLTRLQERAEADVLATR